MTAAVCSKCKHPQCKAQSEEVTVCAFCEDGVPCPVAAREKKKKTGDMLPCSTPGCTGMHRAGNKYPYCTPCQQKGKHKTAAAPALRERLEAANSGPLREVPPRLRKNAKRAKAKGNGHANGNGHGHANGNGSAAHFAMLRVSEEHLNRFLTTLPLDEKAALVSEYLGRA